LKSIIRRIDRTMRRRARVFEFCDDPKCFFRLRVAQLEREVAVPDGAIPAGGRVLEIHMWNERLPTLPTDGVNFSWAANGARRTLYSFREAARYLRDHNELDDVVAVGGESVLFDKIMTRVGFEVRPLREVRGRWLDFWETVHAWLLIWAFNENSLRYYPFRRLKRSEFWMRREAFLERFPPRSPIKEGVNPDDA
jgi:hypothetical protein